MEDWKEIAKTAHNNNFMIDKHVSDLQGMVIWNAFIEGIGIQLWLGLRYVAYRSVAYISITNKQPEWT